MSKNNTYIYHVEVLIEDKHHANALEQLIRKLNHSKFIDYKIISGVQLGNEIEARKLNATTHLPVSLKINESEAAKKKQAYSMPDNTTLQSQEQSKANELAQGFNKFHEYKSENKLIRLIINRGLGIKTSIPCRILNVDENDMILTIYHVDEKQVYTFRMNEIEDFVE